MKSLHIRQIEESTLNALKRRAQRHRRSLQKEIESLLTDAARMEPRSEESGIGLRALIKTVATGRSETGWSREELYGDDAR